MANARFRYDVIAEYLCREHEASAGRLYGTLPAVIKGDEAWIAFYRDALAVRLHGRARDSAKTLPGVRGWNPREPQQEGDEWLLIPASQMVRWERLALDAVRCARERAERGRMAQQVAKAPDPVARQEHEAGLGERFKSLLSRGLSAFGLK